MRKPKAVVLLSGGLDSATCLYWAVKKGFHCLALIFDYGQRHGKEILCAKKIAEGLRVKFEVIKLRLPWLEKSSLVDERKKLPSRKLSKITDKNIPSTYVAARNLIMLSVASSWADALDSKALVIGINSLDYSGYPDCRQRFINAFIKSVKLGSKLENLKILTPLIKLNKAQIVKLALKLKVPLELTWSCYKGGRHPCGKCDSCKLRAKGFEQSATTDPITKGNPK
jgi:7-cyano-7-deazaguanine synthase